VADYNGDNYPDLAVGNENQPIRLYRSNGDGTFTLDWSSAEDNRTTGLSWGDYDGNGDPDLAVGNAGQPNQVYRNDGGVLTLDWSSPIADDNTSAVAWGDWDVDGDLDLAVANRGRPSRVYENIAGALTSAWLSVEQDYATALAWGNWDADEDVELAIANWQAPNRVYDSIGHVRVYSIKQVDKAVARPNETLRYTIVMSNTGSLPAIGARFTDTLPALVTWADALTVNPDVGFYGYDPVGRVITWTGNIAANSAVAIAYQATTLDGLAGGTLITNTALVDDHEGHIVPTAPVTTVIEIPPTVGPPTVTTSTTCSQTVTFPLTVTLGYPAVQRADVVFLLDRTGTMNDVTDEVIAHSADVMNQVAALVSDAAFGAGYFADYNGSFGGCGYSDSCGGGSDVPWAVASDITTDTAAVAQALQVLPRLPPL
jgi:uncharacterized repeat protein (TIGR01451 family)